MDTLAAALWAARQRGELVETGDLPDSTQAAYALQRETDLASGGNICGFKIGATADVTMEMLGLDEPFHGPLYREFCRDNGADVPVFAAHEPKVEAEFVIGIAESLAATDQRSADDIRSVTEFVTGGFEFVGNRFRSPPAKRGLCAIADFGANVDLVIGEKIKEWQSLDFDAHPVTLYSNDIEITSGHSGMSIAGNPFGMVAWLLNQPGLRDRGLLSGDIIACGTCSGVHPVSAGDTLRADFGALGTLTANIVSAAKGGAE